MNIVSVNINVFLGKEKWNEHIDDFQTQAVKQLDRIFEYLNDNIRSADDIVILHEVPYKNNNKQYNEVFEIFEDRLDKNNLALEKPNHMTNYHKPNTITCAIKNKKSNWIINKENYYICSRYYSGLLYANKAVELYNKIKNVYLLGVHIKPANYDPKSSVMWDDIIYYYKKVLKENVIIIGDMNVFAEGTIQKRKFNELVSLGAIDSWTAKLKPFDTPTFDDGDKGTRLDYALMSTTAFRLLKNIDIDDNTRIGNKYFTDHSAIRLFF